jgi:hypothetical protein
MYKSVNEATQIINNLILSVQLGTAQVSTVSSTLQIHLPYISCQYGYNISPDQSWVYPNNRRRCRAPIRTQGIEELDHWEYLEEGGGCRLGRIVEVVSFVYMISAKA